MQLNLFSISDQYITYLRKFDDKIYDNKITERNHTRKYIGVVLNINHFNYYIPFSSPKNTDYYDIEKSRIKKSVIPIIRMTDRDRNNKEKLYGTLRVSNMIPVPDSELIPYLVKEEKDINYQNLILSELRFIKKNTKMILKNAYLLYHQKSQNKDIPYVKSSLNFKLLEEKCLAYAN